MAAVLQQQNMCNLLFEDGMPNIGFNPCLLGCTIHFVSHRSAFFERPRQDPAHESSECVLADEVEISDEEASVEDPNNDGVEAGGDSEEEK